MTDASSLPALRYLSAADVMAAMPPVDERLRLARRTMEALVADAELPPKIGVHPRGAAAFGHAMPAWLRGADADGHDDLLGIKWVVGFPGSADLAGSAGGAGVAIPAIHGTVILSDALTGVPRAIMDAGPITAQRTAAVSGVAIARWVPVVSGRPLRIGLVGAGIQAGSHLPVLAHLLPGSDLSITDRDAPRAAALAETARAGGGFGAVRVVQDADSALRDADVVITLVSFGSDRQAVPANAFAHGALIVAVDYDMCVPASVVQRAALFVVDERGQYLANRAGAVFAGYPDPAATIGEALRANTPRPDGTVVVTHLGVGLADVVFGDAILRVAEARGLGTILPR
jgi:alanine dehydrogenase